MSAPVWVPNWPSTAVTCGIPGQWPWASSIVAVRTPGDGHGRVHRPGRESQRTRGIAARARRAAELGRRRLISRRSMSGSLTARPVAANAAGDVGADGCL
jgi:hypothetical protein